MTWNNSPYNSVDTAQNYHFSNIIIVIQNMDPWMQKFHTFETSFHLLSLLCNHYVFSMPVLSLLY